MLGKITATIGHRGRLLYVYRQQAHNNKKYYAPAEYQKYNPLPFTTHISPPRFLPQTAGSKRGGRNRSLYTFRAAFAAVFYIILYLFRNIVQIVIF